MKKLFPIVICIILLVGCSESGLSEVASTETAQVVTTNETAVTTCETTTTSATTSQTEETQITFPEIQTCGDKMKSCSYDNDSDLQYYIISEYNDLGEMAISTTYNNIGYATKYCIYEYDDEGNEIKNTTYNDKKECKQYIVTEYNEKNQKIYEHTYNKDGVNIYNDEYLYDENNNCVKKLSSFHENNEDVLEFYVINEYDESGKLIKKSNYHADGTPISISPIKCNDLGQINEGYYVYTDEITYLLYSIDYDDLGRKIKVARYYHTGRLDCYTTYEYYHEDT